MEQAVEKARKAWEGAPMHVRAMAGAYVDPLIVAQLEMSAKVVSIESRLKVVEGRLEMLFELQEIVSKAMECPGETLERLSVMVARKIHEGAGCVA